MALFGGCTTTFAGGVVGDLWGFEPVAAGGAVDGRWRRVHTQNPIRKRRGHVVAASASHLLVFGGKTFYDKWEDVPQHGAVCVTDLWLLPLTALREGAPPGNWTAGAPFPGGCFWGATGTVITAEDGRQLLAVYGGRILRHTPEGRPYYVYFDNLWLYDFAAEAWREADVKGVRPHPR